MHNPKGTLRTMIEAAACLAIGVVMLALFIWMVSPTS